MAHCRAERPGLGGGDCRARAGLQDDDVLPGLRGRGRRLRGQQADAERLAREAVAISERTDMLTYQGDTLCVLAEVLRADGRTDDAVAAFNPTERRMGKTIIRVRP